jgi:hypothetical protein
MIDLAAIAVPITVHLGRKLIDKVFDRARKGQAVVADRRAGVVPVLGQQGALRAPSARRSATGFQRVYVETRLEDSIPAHVYDNCVMLVLVVNEVAAENTLLFDADVGEPFVVDLPDGTYSFYSFLVDSRYPDIETAPLYGFGLPSHEDIDDVSTLIEDAPLEVVVDGPDTLVLFVLDTYRSSELPRTFGEFLIGQGELLTGVWLIEGADDFGGDSQSLIDLAQHDDMLSGTATTSYLDDGDHWLVQQLLTGSVSDAGLIQLSSYHVRILKGPAGGKYYPDAWYGRILDTDTIVGRSLDADDQRGQFIMTRQG